MVVDRGSSLLRDSSWSGLEPGDEVAINIPGERRHHYRFVAHVTNVVTGEQWVDVVGGGVGDSRLRSFRSDTVYPSRARRGSTIVGPSLAVAPQLPLRFRH